MGYLSCLLILTSLALTYAVGGDVCVSGHDSGPVFEEQPTGQIYPEGLTEGKVTLTCQARASPAATYRWRLNGSEVVFGADPRYTLVAGNLVITNPRHDRDTGSYQCLAINRCGTIVSRAANLKFGYLHDFPPESRSPQTAYEGAGTFLACQPPAHYPALSYRWFVNEFPSFVQPDGGRWFVSQVTGNLYVAKSQANDTGNYFCFTTISMDISTKSIFSKAIQLTVKSAPSIRVRFPAETYALAGHSAQLECFAYGNPVPKLRWRKLEGVLSAKALASADGPILTLPDLNFEDEGMYECEAYNSEGRDTYQGRIVVQAQPEWLQVMSDSEVEISSELHWSCMAAGKPRPTIRWLRNGQPLSTQTPLLTLPHNKLMMECKPRAAPKPTLFWSRGTELLTNSSRVTVSPDGVLWIYNISRADEGKYTCFAENYLGKANSTGHLSVRDATKITLAPSNADINQGENVTLQCHASHDPTMDLTFTWTMNGVLLDTEEPGQHYHRVEGVKTIGDLVIVNGQLGQAGTYTCSAQTVVDTATASAKLVVRGPPGPPGGLVVKSANETSVELRWSRGYDNHSPISKYLIMGRSKHTHEWRRMRTEPHNIEGNAESAHVNDLRPWMNYEFQVIASNILGSGEPSMPSQMIQTKQAAPTVAPSGLGGGGGDRSELIITWTPMAREYQNGDNFGYILAFRKRDAPTWTVVRVPNVESSRYVYINQSLSPYCPFEVKIKAYNRKGEGPFSQVAVVHSAEEGEIQKNSEQNLGCTIFLQKCKKESADRVRTAGLETMARVSGLRPSTLYHVTVLVYNSAGTGPPSPRTTVITRKPPPNRPPGNISWKIDGSWVTVRWDQVAAMDNESAVLGYKVLYKHEGQSALKVLDKGKTSVRLPLPKDNSYVVLEIRSWGEGGDGAAQEIINEANLSSSSCPLLLLTVALWGLIFIVSAEQWMPHF
uniref:Contactin 2 n=1 Tax=Denticeps clupeoides TaxID=299321 RepID=A0AAY4CNZ4_9TELE